MTLVEHLRQMAANNLWANSRLGRAVLALKPGELEAARTGFFPSIARTLNHILSVDLFYLDMLEEGGVGLAVFDRFTEFGQAAPLIEAQRHADVRLIAFCERLAEADLDRRVISDRGDEGRIPERIADLLAHLLQHDIHHRGQVHAMLSGSSVKPPQLDEFFLDYDLRFRSHEMQEVNAAISAARAAVPWPLRSPPRSPRR